MRILFVCLGNICRSPTAEAVLRQRAPDLSIDSAGTSNWHVGNPPHPPMQRAAHKAGYDMSDLRARQISSSDFNAFDLILAMDADNEDTLRAMAPPNATAKVKRLTDYVDEADHVPDPYYTDDYIGALQLVERCVDALLQDLA
jgi:protein-tyrosine phosphatase